MLVRNFIFWNFNGIFFTFQKFHFQKFHFQKFNFQKFHFQKFHFQKFHFQKFSENSFSEISTAYCLHFRNFIFRNFNCILFTFQKFHFQKFQRHIVYISEISFSEISTGYCLHSWKTTRHTCVSEKFNIPYNDVHSLTNICLGKHHLDLHLKLVNHNVNNHICMNYFFHRFLRYNLIKISRLPSSTDS